MLVITDETLQNKLSQKTVCAIHQPNFFPWLGYFNKMTLANYFVFMDDVALPRTGAGSYTNRVKIRVQKNESWITCPLLRDEGIPKIRDVIIDDNQPWRKKMIKTLELNYKKSLNFENAMAILQPLIEYPSDKLAEFNINAITTIANVLKSNPIFIKQSDLETSGSSTELLINITKQTKANVYLSGSGGSKYQDENRFTEENIELTYQKYTPILYGNATEFIPGLSVIDYLFKAPIFD